MKKNISLSLASVLLAASVGNSNIIKLDGSNGIVNQTIAVGTTNYRIIDGAQAPHAANNGIITWTSDNEYILDAVTIVENGTLVIEEGTVIRGELQSDVNSNDVGALVITRSARIDARGTAANPIIFTTAAIDDGDGNVAGLVINDINPGTGDYFFTKTATQWTPGAIFLDADPKNAPLPPTKNFATTSAGDQPAFFVRDSGNNTLSFFEVDQEHRSLWGGVVILGNSTTNIGLIDANGKAVATVKGDLAGNVLNNVFEGFIEGLNILEVGERGVYGGRNPNDSSGIFQYVSIRHGGANIGEGNEINGLTMGGVGRGTLISHVEVYCNGDDGFEWFGGSVDTKYLISLYNNDDSFDVDEGYTGRNQFWFSLMLDDGINGNHSAEHDGTDALYDSIDVLESGNDDNGMGLVPTFMTVYNATYIGGGEFGNRETDSQTNNGFRIRDSWGGIYRNSIVSDHRDEVIRIDDDNAGRIALGDVVMEGNIFYGIAAAIPSYADVYRLGGAIAGTDPLNLANSNISIDSDPFALRRNGRVFPPAAPKFDRRGLFNGGAGFDPRGSGSIITSDLAPIDPTFFSQVPFKGAFDPNATAATIWTGSSQSASNPAWSVFGHSVLDLQ